jgi:hypothetical protein
LAVLQISADCAWYPASLLGGNRAVERLMTARATPGVSADRRIPAASSFVEGIAAVQGVVTQLRVDLNERFDKIDGKLGGVCEDVAELKTAQAVDSARANWAANDQAVRADQANRHVLSFRWRVGIVVAAAGGAGGALLALVNLVVGH